MFYCLEFCYFPIILKKTKQKQKHNTKTSLIKAYLLNLLKY